MTFILLHDILFVIFSKYMNSYSLEVIKDAEKFEKFLMKKKIWEGMVERVKEGSYSLDIANEAYNRFPIIDNMILVLNLVASRLDYDAKVLSEEEEYQRQIDMMYDRIFSKNYSF